MCASVRFFYFLYSTGKYERVEHIAIFVGHFELIFIPAASLNSRMKVGDIIGKCKILVLLEF